MNGTASPRKRTRLLAALAGVAALAASLGALALAPAAPASAAGNSNPLGTLDRSAADDVPLAGRVEERLEAGSYTYLGVRRDDGSRFWAVTLGRGQPQGARVNIRSYGRRTDFRSARLQRTFPELVFGTVSRAD